MGDWNWRRWTPVIAGMTMWAMFAWLWLSGSPDYFALIRGWGIIPYRAPFLDTDMVLSSVRCLREGFDVYRVNPCDPLLRPDDYSPAWMALRLLPVTPGWTAPVAMLITGGFFWALSRLPTARTRLGVAMISAGAVSSGAVYVMERGNNDLFLFAIATLAALCAMGHTRVRMVGYGALLLAGLLKYYPLLAMATALRERPHRFWMIAAVSVVVVVLFFAAVWHDFTRALAIIPTGPFFSDMFGAISVGGAISHAMGWPVMVRRLIQWGMMAAALVVALRVAREEDTLTTLESLDTRALSFLLVGALFVCGCFFSAQNIGYRVVNLLLVLPSLVALRESGVRGGWRWLAPMALALMWSQGWRRALMFAGWHLAGARGLSVTLWGGWLLREALWWGLCTGLMALVLGFALRTEVTGLMTERLRLGLARLARAPTPAV